MSPTHRGPHKYVNIMYAKLMSLSYRFEEAASLALALIRYQALFLH